MSRTGPVCDSAGVTKHSQRSLLALVFMGGVSSLGAEIAAARLLAPYFGASTIIWANTIGVVLVALSIGYWYGGRLADRFPTDQKLRYVALAAAVLLGLVPIVSGPFFDIVVGAFDRIDAGAFVGSLLGVLILLAIPLVLLGTVTPWALRLAIHEVENAGTVAGRLYALSTIGSLAGVFLSALVLIPLVGVQRTFLLFAAALAITAASGKSVPRRALAVPAILLAALLLPPGLTKPADEGDRVIAEEETSYQYLRVIQDGDRRLLELNEGQAVHSIYDPKTVLTDGVWDGYLSVPLSVLGRPPRTMAMLGNAAGTVSRAYAKFFPETQIDGVEIDGDVTKAGRELFALGENRKLRTYTEDARPFLRRVKKRYDLIGIDAYRQPYIPFYLATREFFDLTKARLAEGGAVVINIGHPEGQDELEKTITKTLGASFKYVARFAIEDTSTLLVASDVPPMRERIRLAAADADPELVPLLTRTELGLAPKLEGGRVYTDDRAPVEWLIDSSIVRYAAGGDGG